MARTWFENGYVAFDTETTGVQEKEDRIISASLLYYNSSHALVKRRTWIINPGVEVPAAATAVNGLSTEYVQSVGMPAAEGVAEILAALAQCARYRMPVVAFNGSFDMTVLLHESRRNGLALSTDFADIYSGGLRLIDGLTMHRKAHLKWKGRRNLGALCEAYNVELGEAAHNATADARAAAELSVKLTAETPELFEVDASSLHMAQRQWYAVQMEDLQAYLRASRGDETITCHPAWPVRR